MADFVNDTVQTLGDPLRNMILALKGNQPAPPPDPSAVQGALSQTLLRQTGDDPTNEFLNSTQGIHEGLGKAGSPLDWAMALAGGPRLQRIGTSGNFNILEGATGKNVGYVNTKTVPEEYEYYRPHAESEPVPVPKGAVWVNNIGSNLSSPEGWRHDWGANSFGLRDTKAILNLLREHYPDAPGISGYRVSGVRGNGQGGGSATFYMPFPLPEPGLLTINKAANAAINRWGDTVHDFTKRVNNYNYREGYLLQQDNMARNPLLNNPDVAEIAARREGARMGAPNWSEVDPVDRDLFRENMRYRNPITGPSVASTPEMEQTIRNRWLGAQQRQWRRDLNTQTADDIARYNENMARVLRGKNEPPLVRPSPALPFGEYPF